MATVRQIIGRVGLVLRGDYDSSATYSKLDVVAYGGKSYASRVDNNSSVPGSNGDWQLMSERGAKGDAFTYSDFTPQQLESLKGDPSTADINLNGSVVTVTNNAGQSRSIDLMNAAEETVVITVNSTAGTSTGGLGLLVYLNDSSTPQTLTTDNAGLASMRVPQGYKYRIVFPVVAGAAAIPDVVHTASVSQRSVEVTYRSSESMSEAVRIVLRSAFYASGSTIPTYSYVTGVRVQVTYNNVSYEYVSDSNGAVSFSVPIGAAYTVTLPEMEGYYIRNNEYVRSMTASSSQRNIAVMYSSYRSGLYIVDVNGNEFTLAQWQERLDAGSSDNSDARMLLVTTVELSRNGANFMLDLDDLANRNYPSMQWCRDNVQFNSIPNSDSRWDGLGDSRLVQAEGDERSLPTPAVDYALGQTRTIAGVEHQGYLGAIRQWYQLWPNATEINSILAVVRPTGNPFSSYTTNKWSSSQYGADGAWYWAAAASINLKNSSSAVVPFFAY